ncbi:MAG: DUF2969 domain-containing protein [Streptococcus mitis]|nr:DUF2969 domain-containing protein [Streptococcus mitis]
MLPISSRISASTSFSPLPRNNAKVNVGKDSFEGYTLTIGKKVIGEIAELDGQFAIIKNGNVDSFYKKLEKAVEILIENYNLAK